MEKCKLLEQRGPTNMAQIKYSKVLKTNYFGNKNDTLGENSSEINSIKM